MTEYVVVITEQSVHYGGIGSIVFITKASNRGAALAAVRVHMHEEYPYRQVYCVVIKEKIYTKKEYLEQVISKAVRV